VPRRNGSLKLVEIAEKIEKILSHPDEYGFQPKTRAGLARAVKVLRGADVLCDGLKARERDATIKLSALTGAFRTLVRES
jgi:hypothetical protein